MKKINRRKFARQAAIGGLGATIATPLWANTKKITQAEVPVGLIGMDTSHSVAFTKYINSGDNGFRVTTAFTTVSKDIPSSYERVDQFTSQLKEDGVKVVDSIEQVLDNTECILLETNDGRLHLEQAKKVIEAKKKVFIDKPVAASFEDVSAIYELANQANVPMFSSSGTRYMSQPQKVRDGLVGQVHGADTFSPVSYEPNHSDLFWYGIHGVELLFTVLRSGCQRVRRFTSAQYDTVVGEWEGGKIGTFRGILHGGKGYGGQVFGEEGLAYLGSWEGYDPLVESILEFFRTGESPIPSRETLEIYAFMEAGRLSSQRNGDWVELNSLEF